MIAYLDGRPDSPYWAKLGVIALLGCTCGEVALIGFEIDDEADIAGNERFAAVLEPQANGMAYFPATA